MKFGENESGWNSDHFGTKISKSHIFAIFSDIGWFGPPGTKVSYSLNLSRKVGYFSVTLSKVISVKYNFISSKLWHVTL